MALAAVCSKAMFFVVDSLLIVTPIVGFCNCSMYCCALLYTPFSFAIILMGQRERAGCFVLFVVLMSRDSCMALPHHGTGMSAVCNCDIY